MSTFALVSQSLRTAEPLHQILPTSLLDRLLHHSHNLPLPAEHVPKISFVERAQSEEFMYFSAAVAAVSQILSVSCLLYIASSVLISGVIQSLDDLHKTTKRICGEVPFQGFDEWRAEYEKIYGPAF